MKHILFYFLLSICWLESSYAQIKTPNEAEKKFGQADTLFTSQDYAKARVLLEQVVVFYRNSTSPLKLGRSLTLLGTVYYKDHDYGTAFTYLKEAEEILTRVKELEPLAEVKRILAGVYLKLENRGIAIRYAREAMQLYAATTNHDKYLEATSNLGFIYYMYHQDDSSQYYSNIVIKNATEKHAKILANAYSSLHGIHRFKKDYSKAILYAERALTYCKKGYGDRAPFTAYAEYYLGWTYKEMKEWEQALFHLQHALIYNHQSFADTSIFSFPPPEGILHLDYQMTFLDYKGECLEQMYIATQDPRYLQASLENYQLAIALIDTLRNSYDNFETQLAHNNFNAPIYLRAISVLEKLYRKKPDKELFQQAFKNAENAKAFWLNRMLTMHHNAQTEIDSLSIINQYLLKQSEVQELEKRQKKGVDVNYQELNKKKEEQQQLLTKLKQEHPAHYQQYFKRETPSIAEIRNALPPNAAMISFAALEQQVLVQYISADALHFTSWDTKDSLRRTINKFVKSITRKEDANYLKLGSEFYRLLILPLEIPQEIEHLIIAPYGGLSYIPFEALLTEQVQSNELIDYTKLPYWGMQKTISYIASAKTWLQQQQLPAAPQTRLLALAPKFEGKYDRQQGPNQSSKNELRSLKGNLQEVELLANIFPGEFLIAKNATKSAFWEQADEATVIHLATHGIVEYLNPAYNAIALSPEGPDSNLFVYGYELYGKNLRTDMVVLSACNTAMGSFEHGEGPLSLAHAFTAAGSKSVVMSLWEVADLSAPTIMGYFYEYLRQGDNKALALQKAKQRYIEESDANGAHPYYWAALTLSGDVAPLAAPASSFNYGWIIWATFPVLALLGVVWYRRGTKAAA